MTPQELISTLKQLHERRPRTSTEFVLLPGEIDLIDKTYNELPRIIRLLEAGEKLDGALSEIHKLADSATIQQTTQRNLIRSAARAALSAYEEAWK